MKKGRYGSELSFIVETVGGGIFYGSLPRKANRGCGVLVAEVTKASYAATDPARLCRGHVLHFESMRFYSCPQLALVGDVA